MASPTINDQFWFDQSQKLVTAARDSRDIAAKGLQSFIGWAWTAFAVVSGLSLSGKTVDTWQTVVTSFALVALFCAYWTATWAQMPALLQFDPRSPEEIKYSYQADIKRRAFRLRIALCIAFLSVILIALSFSMLANSLRTGQSKISAIAVITPVNGSAVIAINAILNTDSMVIIKGITTDAKNVQRKEFAFVAKPVGGIVQVSKNLELPFQKDDQTAVEISWTQTPEGSTYKLNPKVEVKL